MPFEGDGHPCLALILSRRRRSLKTMRIYTGLLGCCVLGLGGVTTASGGQGSPELEPAAIPEAPASRTGFCPREHVEVPVQREHVAFGECYEEQLKQDPRLAGRVDASWTIGPDGRVTRVETVGLQEVGACVARVIKSIRFSPPLIGCEDISDYPFVFQPE